MYVYSNNPDLKYLATLLRSHSAARVFFSSLAVCLNGLSTFRCGQEDVEIDRHGSGICDKPCGGDISSICGGHLAFTAYAVGE